MLVGLQPPTIPGAKADMMVGCGISPSCHWSQRSTLEGRPSTSGQNGPEWHCQPLHCLFHLVSKVSQSQSSRIMDEAQEPQMEKDTRMIEQKNTILKAFENNIDMQCIVELRMELVRPSLWNAKPTIALERGRNDRFRTRKMILRHQDIR